MKRVGLIAVLVALLVPASAGATLIAPNHALLARPAVPPVPRGVTVESAPGLASVAAAGPRTIYVRGDVKMDEYDWLHELGHVYDFRNMSLADHSAFLELIGQPQLPWWGEPFPTHSGGEWFADAMAQLWRLRRRGIEPDRFYSIGEGGVWGSQLIDVAHYLTN